MKKEEKALVIAEIAEKVGKQSSMVLTDFAGMTVEQSNLLRTEFRAAKVEYKVAKNTFFKRAMKELKDFDTFSDYLKGQTGIVFGYDDPIESIRILKKFVEKNNKPVVKAIYFDEKIYPGNKFDELSKLPSKKDLYSSIVGCIQNPIAGVPSVVNSLIGGLISVIEEVAKKNNK
jgi:large subunit ribosomal protein L10